MKTILRVAYVFIYFLFLGYLLLPSPPYPESPEGFSQSSAPADMEDDLRRGYYNDYSREESLDYYQAEFDSSDLGIPFFSFRLNYPPEDAKTLIRDQTKSYYLEEVVHPMRESLYVNGFVAQRIEDEIKIKGRLWEQKNIVKYVPSNPIVRVVVYSLSMALLWVVLGEFWISAKKIWIYR